MIGEDALLLEIDPERGLRRPDHRRKDRFFDGREIFDERTSLLEFFECAEKDLNDLQKGVAVQRVDRQKPLEVMRSISMSEENQEKRQSQERLEKFIVVNQFPRNEWSIEGERERETASELTGRTAECRQWNVDWQSIVCVQ